MILFLDTTSDTYVLALATREGRLFYTRKIVRDERIGDRVFHIVENFLKKKKPTAIIAVTGPGRFSGIRHGMSIANTLAFVWHIPLIGIEKKDNETLQALVKRALLQKTSSSLLTPRYGQEPTITITTK
ncbi:hypothetical protein HY625_02660 [Candidatus Uhrbacteria bacterium]|nr:hypothetical protein [Candidatus Uhrbacteria bacterium]